MKDTEKSKTIKVKLCVSCDRPIPVTTRICPYCREGQPWSFASINFLWIYFFLTLLIFLTFVIAKGFSAFTGGLTALLLSALSEGGAFVAFVIAVVHFLPFRRCVVAAPVKSNVGELLSLLFSRFFALTCTFVLISVLRVVFCNE